MNERTTHVLYQWRNTFFLTSRVEFGATTRWLLSLALAIVESLLRLNTPIKALLKTLRNYETMKQQITCKKIHLNCMNISIKHLHYHIPTLPHGSHNKRFLARLWSCWSYCRCLEVRRPARNQAAIVIDSGFQKPVEFVVSFLKFISVKDGQEFNFL